jgi:hypothetical protein
MVVFLESELSWFIKIFSVFGRIARHKLMHPIYKRELGRITGSPWDTMQVEGARRREISCRALLE